MCNLDGCFGLHGTHTRINTPPIFYRQGISCNRRLTLSRIAKKIIKVFGEAESSGSERHITPEVEWMAKQGYRWTDSEEDIEETVPAAESDEDHEEQWDDFSA